LAVLRIRANRFANSEPASTSAPSRSQLPTMTVSPSISQCSKRCGGPSNCRVEFSIPPALPSLCFSMTPLRKGSCADDHRLSLLSVTCVGNQTNWRSLLGSSESCNHNGGGGFYANMNSRPNFLSCRGH
jgi:hypothetical protein